MDYNFHGGEIKEKIKYDFSVNINPLGMPNYVKNAIAENVDLFSKYPDRFCSNLRQVIANYESVNVDQVICGNGASELLMAICAYKSCGQNINAIIAAPTFSGYERSVNAYSGNIEYYKDHDEIIQILESNKSQEEIGNLIFICNPNNPTGEIVKREKLIDTLEVAKRQNVLVVADECFIDFTHEKSLADMVDSYDNLIVLKAFTKFYAMAGVRLGYICANEKVCEGIASFLPEWNVSTVAQVAGVAAIEDKEKAKSWKQNTLEIIDTEREYLIHELRKIGIEVSDSKANYILCKSNCCDLYNKLLSLGILVRDCSNFKELNSSYIRICVSSHERNKILIEAIHKVMM